MLTPPSQSCVGKPFAPLEVPSLKRLARVEATPDVDQHLTESDLIVLNELLGGDQRQTPSAFSSATKPRLGADVKLRNAVGGQNDQPGSAISRLKALNDPSDVLFQPTVLTTWDAKDIPAWANDFLVKPYTRFATSVVRHPTDIVFLTHILIYLTTNLPSAVYLFYNFTYIHGVLHAVYTIWCTGAFTLMMHNHIHNNGVLSKDWKWLDFAFPYVLEPLMGHTWDSYYYHHVKHHHVEGNGPNDLSSTIRYQRDSPLDFSLYVLRFLLLIWLELPLYFIRKRKFQLLLRGTLSELASYALMYVLTFHVDARAATFVLILPFVQLRLGLMVGNWGQHALVDEAEPDSDFRSSITLIDVPSNRYCFNDGYHTAHHLNPRRHWREQPVHFLQSKEAYASGRALVFHDIDYIMMTVKLLQKDYGYLADRLVPIGEQVNMSREEIAVMLRAKTRKFTEEDIKRKFKT